MGKSAYPTATELNSFLTEAGFVLGSLDTATAVEAAVDEFHRRTGRIMLAPVGAAVRYYDPPAGTTRFLDLEADLAVLTSIVYAPTGQTLTQ
ncbi:MAG: hypothetical protein FJX77_10180, partial [Armatimonadetes bacterium]|nr:hypothetical protein [Armatimonadota bacterium]